MVTTKSRRALPKSRAQTIRFQLPLYVLVPFWLFVGMGLLTLGWLAMARRGVVTDPFAAYRHVFTSEYGVIAARQEFACHTDTFRSNDIHVDRNANGYRQCTHNPAAGLFSRITVYNTYTTGSGLTDMNERTSRINFMVRENAITIGDLALLWGRPRIHPTNRCFSLAWPEHSISASVLQPSCHGLDYFLPVVSVTFHVGARR